MYINLSDDLNKVFKDCNTKFVVTIPDLVPKVKEARAGLRDIKVIYIQVISVKTHTRCKNESKFTYLWQ